jgi:hypothetical protein
MEDVPESGRKLCSQATVLPCNPDVIKILGPTSSEIIKETLWINLGSRLCHGDIAFYAKLDSTGLYREAMSEPTSNLMV